MVGRYLLTRDNESVYDTNAVFSEGTAEDLHMNRLWTIFIILILCGWIQSCGASQTPVVSEPETAVSAAVPVAANNVQTASAVEDSSTESAVVAAAQNDDTPSLADATAAAESEEKHNEAMDDIPADFFRCEVKLSADSELYTAQSIGPTLEEARDNAVDEACAVPCAEKISDSQLSDDDAEKAIDTCTEKCSDDADVLAAICWQNHKSVYTEGEWSETGDEAPTNGAEILDTQQVQE